GAIGLGSSVRWDGTPWRVVNFGRRTIGLQDDAGHIANLATDDAIRLVQKGMLVDEPSVTRRVPTALRRRLTADENDLELALRRLETVKPGATSGYEPVAISDRWRRELKRRCTESE